MEPDATLPPSLAGDAAARQGVPGLIHVFSAGTPAARALRFRHGEIILGRNDETLGDLKDLRVSRRHARVHLVSSHVTVTDLDSQNGTFVDGQRLPAGATAAVQRVLRVGDSIFIPSADIVPFERFGVATVDGFVRGPAMQELLVGAMAPGRLGATLHIHGESGTGKEGVARAYHTAAGRRDRPFVAVNCAAIPETIAERLLFGAKRGAYSGADADAPGYFQSADGGTLFLDEVVELDLTVQAKLLRVIESREVLPLGAAHGRKIDVHVCSATHRDMRALAADGKLREDLFFRIGRPEVRVPPLRQRTEEIPHLLARAVPNLPLHVSLVETCILRAWPGNVRELLVEAGAAAHKATLEEAPRVEAHHLAPGAGTAFQATATPPVTAAIETRTSRALDPETHARIVEALRQHGGNVTAAARALGLHRTQLRRLLERHGIDTR